MLRISESTRKVHGVFNVLFSQCFCKLTILRHKKKSKKFGGKVKARKTVGPRVTIWVPFRKPGAGGSNATSLAIVPSTMPETGRHASIWAVGGWIPEWIPVAPPRVSHVAGGLSEHLQKRDTTSLAGILYPSARILIKVPQSAYTRDSANGAVTIFR